MDKKSNNTPAADTATPEPDVANMLSDAAETIAKEIAVAAIVKKAPALMPIARPLVDAAVGMSGRSSRARKKGRKI